MCENKIFGINLSSRKHLLVLFFFFHVLLYPYHVSSIFKPSSIIFLVFELQTRYSALQRVRRRPCPFALNLRSRDFVQVRRHAAPHVHGDKSGQRGLSPLDLYLQRAQGESPQLGGT